LNFEIVAFGAGGPNGQPIAYLDMFEYQKDEQEEHENALADVRLICAAPELLEALKLYVDVVGGVHDSGCPEDDTCDCKWKYVNDQVNAAIAKVENGRSLRKHERGGGA
jgi:hypothetical protein